MVHRNRNSQRQPSLLWYLVGLSFILAFSLLFPTSWSWHTPELDRNPHEGVENNNFFDLDLELQRAPLIPARSLTAIFPLTLQAMPFLGDILQPLLTPSPYLFEIVIVCPASTISEARTMLRKLDPSISDYPDIRLYPLVGRLDLDLGVIDAASQVSTGWVLVMNEHGLLQTSNFSQALLLHPLVIPVPIGPKGVSVSASNSSCIIPSAVPQRASYLYPPFVMPTSLTMKSQSASDDPWAALGYHISESRSDGHGGIVIGLENLDSAWCSASRHSAVSPVHHQYVRNEKLFSFHNQYSTLLSHTNPPNLPSTSFTFGTFAIFLPALQDLRAFSTFVCLLKTRNHDVNVLIYEELDSASNRQGWDDRHLLVEGCRLTYSVSLSHPLSHPHFSRHTASNWVKTFGRQPDIVLGLSEEAQFIGLSGFSRSNDFYELILIPRSDLPHCSWMFSLSLAEWQNWNAIRIDVSIITKDRPFSLTRLLSSLTSGIFFGDTVDLRINLEQSSDDATMMLAESFNWTYGSFFLHHRVIQGGLLPAIVESWYPRSNSSYGLLLEDDVELSPLFYAWAKMCLLRYRHGDPSNRSPHLFGISLYQQKNVELPAEGRRAFNARSLFFASGFSDPSTPYLSPVPCSWGAVYFPEHWREFHSYLSLRLSEHSMKIDEMVVPNVRSNRWKKSWKKYFIELVYLRGYVMLYPNYPNFVSLSTNHLEVGSHVKVRSKEKQELFIVPLMPLSSSPPLPSRLLEMPDNTLPEWSLLPVLNLTGDLTALKSLAEIGRLRRTELTGCIDDPALYDVRDLMCIGG